jgi:hypothetical protein
MSERDTTPGGAGADKPALAEWTIMIYQASDNDLAEDSIRALTDTRREGTSNSIHVIAQLDPNNPRMPTRRLVLNVRGKKNRRAVLEEDRPDTGGARPQAASSDAKEDGHLGDDAVPRIRPGRVRFRDLRDQTGRGRGGQTTPLRVTAQRGSKQEETDQETDTANPETLFDFVSWSQENFPAKHYMLVLSGHSSGVETGFLLKDQNPTGSMSFEDLKKALEAIRTRLKLRLDILGMDSCLINMAEICYEFRAEAGILIGAQSRVPSAGWPYHDIVKAMKDSTRGGAALAPEDLARIVVEKYIDFYSEKSAVGGLSVDLGALRLGDKVEAVAGAVKGLASMMYERLDDPGFRDDLILSHWAAQSYGGELYVDLRDFNQLLKERYELRHGAGEVPAAFAAVRKTVDEMVISSCFIGVDFQYAHGVSIYFPWSSIFTGYAELAFAGERVSNWLSFLNEYVTKTRRAPRGARAAAGTADAGTVVAEPTLIVKSNFRDDPPWRETAGLGLYGRVRSMRNPPVEHPTGIESCNTEETIKDLFRQFTTQLS